MIFVIPDVPLIPQSKNMACWYASAQMLIQWRRERTQSCESDHPDPSDDDVLVQRERANNGLACSQVVDLAQRLDLEPVPPESPTLDTVAGWLRDYGPIWFAGLVPTGHAMVITGVIGDNLIINDPWPPNRGAISHMTSSRFAEVLQPLGGGANITSNFLHFPG